MWQRLSKEQMKNWQEVDKDLKEVKAWVETDTKPTEEQIRVLPDGYQRYARSTDRLEVKQDGVLRMKCPIKPNKEVKAAVVPVSKHNQK